MVSARPLVENTRWIYIFANDCDIVFVISHRGIRWERPCPMDIVLVGAPIDRAEALPYVILPLQGIDAPNGIT
jgi:hypothetical protein